MGIENLEEALRQKEGELKQKEKQRIKENIEHQLAVKDAKEREEILLDEKLQLAEYILHWSKQFVKTEIFARIYNTCRHRFSTEEVIWIYSGGWGHEPIYTEERGCWSRIYLRPDGAMQYFCGYKSIPHWGEEMELERLEDLAVKLNHEYVTKFWRSIESGEIYSHIERHSL